VLLRSGLLPSGFPTETLHAPFMSAKRATCPAYVSLLDLITRMIFGEEKRQYKKSVFYHSLSYRPVQGSMHCSTFVPLRVFLIQNDTSQDITRLYDFCLEPTCHTHCQSMRYLGVDKVTLASNNGSALTRSGLRLGLRSTVKF
jgi:hypothetical protein